MSEENRLELAMTVHFTVPHGMAREDAHRLMVERFTCWLSDPDNDLRRTWGLFSPATVPEVEPCIAVLSGHTSTNLLEGWNGGHGEDRRTGLTEGQEALWQALVPTGGQPAPHLAERLGLDLHETQADLRCLERRGLANRDAEGLWWRTYL